MNPDDHLESYFATRSPHVDVPAGDLGTIVTRARRRRHRRTGVRIAAVAGVFAIGGAVAAQGGGGGDDGQGVESYGAAVVDTPLDWTLVEPDRAIGQSLGSATTADGAIYDLSTAPGRTITAADYQRPTQLYRTTDGTEWSTVALPDGLRASGVAASGDRLYAVGTAPAGGGTGIQAELVSSDEGGSWDRVAVPIDLAALGEGFPGTVEITRTAVATAGDTTLVGVTVAGRPVVGDLLPQPVPAEAEIRYTSAGVEVYVWTCVEQQGDQPAPPATAAPTTTAPAPPAGAGADPVGASGGSAAGEERAGPKVCNQGATPDATYTWADLGLDPEVGRLVRGQTFLFAAEGDGALEPAGELAEGARLTHLLGGPDGFWTVSETDEGTGEQTSVRTEARFSPDGRDWSAAPAELAGYGTEAGMLAGRPTVALRPIEGDGGLVLATLDPAGIRSTDVVATVGSRLDSRFVTAVAFGPRGVALATTPIAGSGDDRAASLVHSADGVSFSVVEVPDAEPGRATAVVGLTVSADAITARLTLLPDGPLRDDAPAPEPYAFVGTP